MSDKPTMDDDEPVLQHEPEDDGEDYGRDLPPSYNVWMRGLYMIVFAILFAVAETVLLVGAVLQFAWMLLGRKRNGFIADFGAHFGVWLNRVVEFQTGRSDDKPFPWDSWGK